MPTHTQSKRALSNSTGLVAPTTFHPQAPSHPGTEDALGARIGSRRDPSSVSPRTRGPAASHRTGIFNPLSTYEALARSRKSGAITPGGTFLSRTGVPDSAESAARAVSTYRLASLSCQEEPIAMLGRMSRLARTTAPTMTVHWDRGARSHDRARGSAKVEPRGRWKAKGSTRAPTMKRSSTYLGS